MRNKRSHRSWFRWRLSTIQLLGFTVCVATVSAFLVACDPGEFFRVENQTDQVISVYEDDNYIKDIAPGDAVDFQIIYFRKGIITYQVRGIDGEILAERTFTWDEINAAHGFTLIVKNANGNSP